MEMSKNQLIKLNENFTKSVKRLILFDYDGTLMPYMLNPDDAAPSLEVKRYLRCLASNKKNHVAVISGRDKDTLEKWLGELELDLAAEHGAWFKEKNTKHWITDIQQPADWQNDAYELLSKYVSRLPGSFIERKTFTMTFHYRKCEEQAIVKLLDMLKADIEDFIVDKQLQVLKGSKVLDIREPAQHKGKAIQSLLLKENYDFILAVGDDTTDEDMFRTLPFSAYSVKIGQEPSYAKFYMKSQDNIHRLFEYLLRDGG